eukprot:2103446-Amphidinium_carterae.2
MSRRTSTWTFPSLGGVAASHRACAGSKRCANNKRTITQHAQIVKISAAKVDTRLSKQRKCSTSLKLHSSAGLEENGGTAPK